MKLNKIKLLLVTTLLLFSFTGCRGSSVTVNVENQETLNNTILGKDALIYIGDGLYYDSATKIVYLMIDRVGGFGYLSAYYAPNGLPYKYNSETNTFEEIEVE